MALRYAVANGNWSSLATWDGGASLPGAGDDVHANGKTITIDQDVTVLSVDTLAASPAVAGGGFTLSAGWTLTANVIAGTTTCVTFSAASPGAATITGNVTGSTASGAAGVTKSGTGTLSINGDITGGGVSNALGIAVLSSGTVNITGAIYGVASANTINVGATGVVMNVVGNLIGGNGGGGCILTGSSANCTINITGNVTAGTSGVGISGYGAGTVVNVTGNVTGGLAAGAYGVQMEATGATTNIYGEAIASSSGTPGLLVGGNTPCYVQIARANDYPNAGTAAGAGSKVAGATGYINVDAMIFGSGGGVPVSGRHFARNAGTNYVTMRESNAGPTLNMGELSADYPAIANVRSGVSYDFGNKTGTCAVPPAGSVALGVPVGATTGTAALSPTDLLGATRLARLDNCATVQSTGDQLAALGV